MHAGVVLGRAIVKTGRVQHAMQAVQKEFAAKLVPQVGGTSPRLVHAHGHVDLVTLHERKDVRRAGIIHVACMHGAHRGVVHQPHRQPTDAWGRMQIGRAHV